MTKAQRKSKPNPQSEIAKLVQRSEHWQELSKRLMTVMVLDGGRVCVMCGCCYVSACPEGCSWMLEFPAQLSGVCSECWPQFMKRIKEM